VVRKVKNVQPLTGYARGGVTVLGAKKPYPAFVDAAVLNLPSMSVSGGLRGLQIVIAPADYVRATGATLVKELGRRNDKPAGD
jgi:Cys-tRNA(Pro)/Cys-tRNA(Cys) deacylase